jgi:hypothetical protein
VRLTLKRHSRGKWRARAFADRSVAIRPKSSWWPVANELELSDGENQDERSNWLGLIATSRDAVKETWLFRTKNEESVRFK